MGQKDFQNGSDPTRLCFASEMVLHGTPITPFFPSDSVTFGPQLGRERYRDFSNSPFADDRELRPAVLLHSEKTLRHSYNLGSGEKNEML